MGELGRSSTFVSCLAALQISIIDPPEGPSSQPVSLLVLWGGGLLPSQRVRRLRRAVFLLVTSMLRIRNVSKSEIVTNMPLSGTMACHSALAAQIINLDSRRMGLKFLRPQRWRMHSFGPSNSGFLVLFSG